MDKHAAGGAGGGGWASGPDWLRGQEGGDT